MATLLPAGSLDKVIPGAVCKPIKVNEAGHRAPPVVLAGLHDTAVHAKPVDTGSNSNAPSAAAGPRLLTVNV